MKKLVIFDLDGTLFNTSRAIADCGNYALEHLGLELQTTEFFTGVSGAPILEFTSTILTKAGDPEGKNFDEFWRLYLEKNAALPEDANVPYEGIPALLKGLKEKGLILAVLSNKDEESCIPIVENAFGKEAFDLIAGGKDSVPPKPDPAAVRAILARFGVLPEECLYVGDTEVDMQTGKNAGLDTVAVLWGYRKKEVLLSYAPEHVVSSPEQILALV